MAEDAAIEKQATDSKTTTVTQNVQKLTSTPDIKESSKDYEKEISEMIHLQIDNYGLGEKNLSTTIELKLSHFGDIKDLQIDTSSGDRWFDKRVLAAVDRAAPFFATPLYGNDYNKIRKLQLRISNEAIAERSKPEQGQ